ncbi:uncharacterized protein LOC144437599 [Glandiceps talaboti]
MPSLHSQVVVRCPQLSPTVISNGEIDELVKKVSETLRLKARQKQRAHHHRSSPYGVPCKHCRIGLVCHSEDCAYLKHIHSGRIKKRTGPSQSHELLEELLRQGNLVNEAVQRLQRLQEESNDRNGAFKRKFSYSDSEDDNFSQPPSPAC